MTEDKPLPNPHKRPWEKGGPDEGLLAEKMARAMAENRLDEFVAEEFEGNENAVRLAEFMMQMTGMGAMPSGGKSAAGAAGGQKKGQATKPEGEAAQSTGPQAADVSTEKDAAGEDSSGPATGSGQEYESGIPEELSRIAAENNVDVEWVVSRALSLYIRDYRATGRL